MQNLFEKIFRKTRSAYRNCFIDKETNRLSKSAEIVLKDLQGFCHAYHSTAVEFTKNRIDPLVMAEREGRRQVYNLIINHLKLDYSQLQKVNEVEIVQFQKTEEQEEEDDF